MWLQRLTTYLLSHRLSAIALAFVSTFIPIVGLFGILLAALITLVKGFAEGVVFTIAATLPYLISFYFSGSHAVGAPLLVIWAAVVVAIGSNILTFAFAIMLRRQVSFSTILQVAALLGVLIVSVLHLAYPNIGEWWGAELQSYYNQASTMASKMQPMVPMAKEMQLESISMTKQYATGLMMAAILFNAILQLIVARWWQTKVFTTAL